jgi:hypothetical protein
LSVDEIPQSLHGSILKQRNQLTLEQAVGIVVKMVANVTESPTMVEAEKRSIAVLKTVCVGVGLGKTDLNESRLSR